MRSDLPRNTGIDADGVAKTEVDHFMKCPACSQWFDMRDLAQVFDASEFEILEGPGPQSPVH